MWPLVTHNAYEDLYPLFNQEATKKVDWYVCV